MADDDKADRSNMDWTVRLNGVERLDREDGDEGDLFYDVEFELSGPGVTGMLSAMVVDPVHETTIITEALDMLLVGLEEFAAAARLQMKPGPADSRFVPGVEGCKETDSTRQAADALVNEMVGDQQRRERPADGRLPE